MVMACEDAASGCSGVDGARRCEIHRCRCCASAETAARSTAAGAAGASTATAVGDSERAGAAMGSAARLRLRQLENQLEAASAVARSVVRVVPMASASINDGGAGAAM